MVLQQLNKNKDSIPTSTRLLLVKSLILPFFDYCCIVYDDITDELNSKLERSLNACIRFIYNLRKMEHITPYRIESRLLNVASRRQFFMANLLYSIIANKSPSYLFELFTFKGQDGTMHDRIRERKSVFIIPPHRTCKMQRSFVIRGSRLWNILPNQIRNATSFYVFKKAFFEFLFEERDEIFNVTHW